jgi:hypothetical protein
VKANEIDARDERKKPTRRKNSKPRKPRQASTPETATTNNAKPQVSSAGAMAGAGAAR